MSVFQGISVSPLNDDIIESSEESRGLLWFSNYFMHFFVVELTNDSVLLGLHQSEVY